MRSKGRVQLQLYGIQNCDSCRSALRWLRARDVPHSFHDLREEPLPDQLLQSWLESPHGPKLLNRRSTTWRQLADDQRKRAETDPAAVISEHPTLLKRPVITDGAAIVAVGFDADRLEEYG